MTSRLVEQSWMTSVEGQPLVDGQPWGGARPLGVTRLGFRALSGEAVWVFAAQILAALGGFVGIRALTGLLSPAVYGVLALVLGGVAFVTGVAFGPLNNAAIRFYHEQKDAGQGTTLNITVLWSYLATCGAILVPILAFAAAGRLWSFPTGFWLMVIGLGGALLLADSLRLPAANLLCIARRRKLYALVTVLDASMRPLTATALILLAGAAVWSALLGYAAGAFLVACWTLFLWARAEQVGWRDRGSFSWGLTRRMLAYGWPFLGTSLASWILAISGRFVLGAFRSNAEVGLYAAAYQVGSSVPQLLGTAYALLATPILIQNYERDSGSGAEVGPCLGFFIVAATGLVGIIILFPQLLLNLLTGKAFRTTAPVVSWIAAAIFLSAVEPLAAVPFILRKQTGRLLKFRLMAGGINLALNFLLIPFFGALGAALAMFAGFGSQFALSVWQGRKILNWPLPYRELLAAALAAVLAAAAAFLLDRGQSGVLMLEPAAAWFLVYVPAASGSYLLLRRMRASPGVGRVVRS